MKSRNDKSLNRSSPGATRFGVSLLATILVWFAFMIPAAAQSALKPTFHPTLRAASEAAAADQTLVLLIFGAEWCAPCKELKKITLNSPEFLEQGGGLHITEVDIDADAKTAHDFSVVPIPALFLLTADGKIVARETGFLYTTELLLWVQEGRRRAKAGQWEGTAPVAKFDEFIKKAATDGLGTNDLQSLVALLGESDPADRASAAKIILAQREQAMPPLIEAVGDPYLGVRIAAAETLRLLAPDTVAIDPWQSPAELSSTVVALKQWWVETGKLPPRDASHAPDPVAENSIKEALDVLRSDDPMKRTEAMAALVGHRAAALPAIREAVKRSERAGDQRSILFLEDVRWAILIPDTIEQRADGVRNALARGKSPERQSAATRLGRAGREALPALTELVNDSDPLVVESAVRALTGIGGKDAISAMAALLQAADSNLRMTAAQALGHTKNSEALKPLLTVFDDPNEVVACTALSALEEIRSGNTSYRSSSGSSLPDDIATALRHCLSDARWRVRAAAVEVIGKLSANNLTKDLKKLLDDPDGFVVKNTLAALSQLNAIPDVEQLAALSKRLPSLRGDAVEMMLISETDETARKVTEIFNASSTDEQAIILNALARRETDNEGKTNDVWKPMLTWATTATDARLRRTAAEVLGKQSSKLAAELIGPLLADEDQETRVAAANDILVILARESGASQSSRMFSRMTDSTSAKTNKAVLTPGRMTVWHAAMLQHAEQMSNLTVAAAVFVTGDGKSDLPLLVAALEKMDTRVSKRQDDSATLGLVVSRLPWPEGQPLLDKLCSSPLLYAMAARGSSRATPAVADYLLEPSRFKSVVERVNGQDLTSALQLLAGYNYDERPPWSLWSETDRTRAVAVALVESTNAAWRATAVFSLGLRLDAEKSQSVFEKAITDSNAWVRAAAVQVMTRITKDRAVLEGRLGPLLADTDLNVAGTAAVALLEPEVRQAAGLESEFNCFRFENVRGGRSASSGTSDERPLTTLENKPTFLPQARERLTATNAEASVGFALLLAQYGEFSGVDRLIAETNREKRRDVSEAILTGIALSRDAKYLPALRQMTEALTDEWELRKILQALKGMTGPDARQLRLEINKRMRNASGGVPSID